MHNSDEPANFLNPDTYLNHLSSTEGRAYQTGKNFPTIILGAALWDVLAYLVIDSRIVRDSRFNFNIFCFIFSRLLALGLVFLSAARFPTDHFPPKLLYILSGCTYMLAMMMSSFLFLQRVLAIYHGNRRVRRCFSTFWFVVSLSNIIIMFGGHPRDIPGIKFNKDSEVDPWVTISIWFSFSFDTAVTLAITYKMWLSHRLPSENSSWYHLASGKTLPQLPRLIFRGGLQYYLIIIGWVMTTGIAVCSPFVPQNYKTMFPAITIFLMASMASRVFRNVKLFDSDHLFTESAPARE